MLVLLNAEDVSISKRSSQCSLLLPLAHQHLEVSGVWSQDLRLPWVHGSLAQTARLLFENHLYSNCVTVTCDCGEILLKVQGVQILNTGHQKSHNV